MIVIRRTAALLSSTAILFAGSHAALAAFNPQAGAESATSLPDPAVLYAPKTSASGMPVTMAPVVAPLYPSHAMVPVMAVAPVAAVETPQPAGAAFPPVDPAVAAQAQAIMQQQAVGAAPPGFIAPAPLMAMPVPVANALPVAGVAPESTGVVAVPAAPTVMASAPAPMIVPVAEPTTAVAVAAPMVVPADAPLSTASKDILSRIPSRIDTAKPSASPMQKLKVERMSPDIADLVGKNKDPKAETYNTTGLSIKVSRPGMDSNFELNRAYTALMGGDTENAIQIYKNILSTQPTNQDALFGLAATYHRLGELEKARPLYGQLLKVNPNHREGLNNFLALLSEESPQEALAELERLEQRNPDFSPIPAQEAIVLDKLGYIEESRAKMLRAIDLAPDNLTYKYNLAIMSDRNGNYADASALYRMLIDASMKGATIPAAADQLQKRLNYITTVAAAHGVDAAGG